MAMILKAILILMAMAPFAYAIRFDPYELADILRSLGVPNNNQLNEWMCIIEHESSFDTKVINKDNDDGSWDYGLFQINSRYWCSQSSDRGGGCNVRCKDLLSNDVEISLRCALQIKSEQGLDAWVAWQKKCRGRTLKDYTGCSTRSARY